MTIDEKLTYLHKLYPEFDKKVTRDVDINGRDFCETVIPNKHIPSMPITVCITEEGCGISVGQIENVTSDDTMSPQQTASAINDIINGRIIFVLGYNHGDDVGYGKPFMSRIFAITGGEDDMSDQYERFLARISKKPSKICRYFTSLKGRFQIFSFNGSVNKTIFR